MNDETPSSIIKNILFIKAYAEIELGTPKQFIQIPLTYYSNDFYISDNAKYEFINFPEKYNNLKFFDSFSSETCEEIVEGKLYDGDNFDFSQYYKDFFYFNEKKVELEFYLPVALKEAESGGIGLQLWPRFDNTTSTKNDKRTFLRKLKELQLISEFYWSVFYNSKDYKNKEGFLFLGSLPHNLSTDLGYYEKDYFDSQYLRSIRADQGEDYIEQKIQFDEIYAFEGNNKKKKISDIQFPENNENLLTVEINNNCGGIRAPNTFLDYFKKYFDEYINKEQCFMDVFHVTEKKFYFFYCRNDKNLISNIKTKFPGFNYKNHEFEFNFDIFGDDLFYEQNNYIYLLMFFPSASEETWVMGRPFLQKYQFFINPEKKNINFYVNSIKTNKEEGKNNKNIILYILIIVFLVIIFILGFFLWKFYFKARKLAKKRANELDDGYEYEQIEDSKKKEDLNAINE